MAYILTGHMQAGPFPHKKGEFVGNYRAGSQDGASGWYDPTLHRLGRPRPVNADSTVAAMVDDGWQGKYLLADQDPWRDITPVTSKGILDGWVVVVEFVADGTGKGRWQAVDAEQQNKVDQWSEAMKQVGREPMILTELAE